MVNYHEYIESPAWKAKADERRELDLGMCRVCGINTGALPVHHRTYERLGCEVMIDLMTVCVPCHQAIHDDWDFVKAGVKYHGFRLDYFKELLEADQIFMPEVGAEDQYQLYERGKFILNQIVDNHKQYDTGRTWLADFCMIGTYSLYGQLYKTHGPYVAEAYREGLL